PPSSVAPPVPGVPRPVSPSAKPLRPKTAVPVASPVDPALPPPQAKPVAPPPQVSDKAKPTPVAPAKADASKARRATDLVAEQAVKESGFDPRTGRIADADRFAQWKQQKAKAEAPATYTNAGLMEVFRKARTQIETWLDEEEMRPLVLALDLDAL